MAYSTVEGRTQILDDSAAAVLDLAEAVAALGEAYEQLDEDSGDRLEAILFKPLQSAYGQLQRTHTEFAARVGLNAAHFSQPQQGAPEDPRALLERAADAIQAADDALAELQDTLLPVEVGDQQLRSGLSSVRTTLGRLPEACDEFVRTLGR
ncbi:MAG TPA: hypothetical protein VME01_04500 [Solirubrobacteraceae bacterium]|nr:hypothetical protein [Solirubrobacteraceae bacterium]